VDQRNGFRINFRFGLKREPDPVSEHSFTRRPDQQKFHVNIVHRMIREYIIELCDGRKALAKNRLNNPLIHQSQP